MAIAFLENAPYLSPTAPLVRALVAMIKCATDSFGLKKPTQNKTHTHTQFLKDSVSGSLFYSTAAASPPESERAGRAPS